jgi:hypothetical protein
MDEKAARVRPWRFGVAGLLALVVVAAIVAALWNPFPRRHARSEFLAIEPGTPSKSVLRVLEWQALGRRFR